MYTCGKNHTYDTTRKLKGLWQDTQFLLSFDHSIGLIVLTSTALEKQAMF